MPGAKILGFPWIERGSRKLSNARNAAAPPSIIRSWNQLLRLVGLVAAMLFMQARTARDMPRAAAGILSSFFGRDGELSLSPSDSVLQWRRVSAFADYGVALDAAGAALPMFGSLCSLSAAAQDARNSVKGVSPRGTPEGLDDYPYWGGKGVGYFGDIDTANLPAIIEADSSAQNVGEGAAERLFVHLDRMTAEDRLVTGSATRGGRGPCGRQPVDLAAMAADDLVSSTHVPVLTSLILAMLSLSSRKRS